jgi:serine/threonine-protein kinase
MDNVQQILCPFCHKPNLRRARFCQHCGHDVVLNNAGPRYYITRIIKEGGQGAVYQAIDDQDRDYAVKEMLERTLDSKDRAEALQRFNEEATLLQRLSHPRIPRVYAHFKDEGRNYLVMDFVRGQDLEQILERDGALPEARVLDYADQLCDVLTYLHDNRLIYRDMKPSNVMIEATTGSVKLVDFGIAKVFQRQERGTQIGTPGYAPPEQYQGLATVESDIYSLGATLHHMLTGRDPRDEVPFSFPSVRSLAPSVSQRTSDAVGRALQMRPEDRYHSVAEFRALLRPLPPAPPQVRRAPAAAALPARSQAPVATGSAAVPAVPAVQQPAIPAPPKAQEKRRRRGFGAWLARTIRNLLMLVVLLAVATGALWYFFPEYVEPYLPAEVISVLPRPASITTTPTSQQFEVELEVDVPTGAGSEAVRQAFVDAYVEAAVARFGPQAVVDTNVPISMTGEPEKLATNDTTDTYRATVLGRVQAPVQP